MITNGLIGNRLILGGGGVVLLAIAFRLFVAMGKKRDAKNAAAPMPTSTMIMSGDNGTAYMTISAIDSLVQRHCRANAKVKECESVVAVSYTHLDVYKRQIKNRLKYSSFRVS